MYRMKPLTAIFPGRYVQGPGVLEGLGEELARLDCRRLLVVAGGTARRDVLPHCQPRWPAQLQVRVESFGGECSQAEVDRLVAVAREQACDAVVGLGGGKVMDTAKAVAHFAGHLQTVIVPTIASTDAPTSAVVVLYHADGTFDHYVFLPRNPDLVLVDSEVIARAPKRFLVAGMGDARIGTPSGWLPLEAAVVERAREVCRRGRIRQVASRARLGLLCRAGEPFEARGGGGAGALETGGPTRPRGLRERSG
jgi:glycerol dehydrogenase